MVIGYAPGLGIADQYGSAHASPAALGLVVLIVVVVVVVVLSKRGKLANGGAGQRLGRAFCGFPVSCYRGGRGGPAVPAGVQPPPPAAGLPIRLRPGPSRRRSSACAAARPGRPRGHGSRRSGLGRRSRAPSAAAGGAGPTTRR